MAVETVNVRAQSGMLKLWRVVCLLIVVKQLITDSCLVVVASMLARQGVCRQNCFWDSASAFRSADH